MSVGVSSHSYPRAIFHIAALLAAAGVFLFVQPAEAKSQPALIDYQTTSGFYPSLLMQTTAWYPKRIVLWIETESRAEGEFQVGCDRKRPKRFGYDHRSAEGTLLGSGPSFATAIPVTIKRARRCRIALFAETGFEGPETLGAYLYAVSSKRP